MGGDDAGVDYKAALTKDLKADPRVSEVIDVGPESSSDKTAYPHFAIAAAELVAQGKADRACEILCPDMWSRKLILGCHSPSVDMRYWSGRCDLGEQSQRDQGSHGPRQFQRGAVSLEQRCSSSLPRC